MTATTSRTIHDAFSAYTDVKLMRDALADSVNTLWASPMRIVDCQVTHAWQKIYVKPTSAHKSHLIVCYRLELRSKIDGAALTSLVHGRVYPGLAQFDVNAHSGNVALCKSADAIAVLRRFPDDPKLPQLPQLMDSRTVIDSIVRASGHLLCPTQVLTSEVIQYRPATRCALSYVLRFDTDSEPHRVFAKTYSNDTGQRVHARLQSLRNAGKGNAAKLLIAEPIGYDMATHTVWQQYVDGTNAAQAIASSRSPTQTAVSVAQALAALHSSSVTTDHTTTRSTLVHETAKRVAKLTAAYPTLAHLLQYASQRCAETRPCLLTSIPVPIHGDAHLEQFLIRDGNAITVDWDELSIGDGEQDLASLIVDLKLRGAETASLSVALQDVINGYFHALGRPLSPSLLAWHLCLQCLNKGYRLHWRCARELQALMVMITKWAIEYANNITSPRVTLW